MVTVSVGVAAVPQHGTTPKTLLEAADAALYRAKRKGRDRVAVAEALVSGGGPLVAAAENDASWEVDKCSVAAYAPTRTENVALDAFVRGCARSAQCIP